MRGDLDSPMTVTGTVTVGSGTTTPPTGSAYAAVSTASTNAAVVKASAGNLHEITATNPTATPAFLKLYNKATAPTVGTDVPLVTIPLAANAVQAINFGALGKRFAAGIAIAITGAITAADATASVAGVQVSASYL